MLVMNPFHSLKEARCTAMLGSSLLLISCMQQNPYQASINVFLHSASYDNHYYIDFIWEEKSMVRE